MFDESDGEGNFAVSFEEIEKLEAQKSSLALLELDSKLYSDTDPIIISVDSLNANLEDGKFPRYYDSGYSANHDGVEDKEILQWRRAFPYLEVKGTKLYTPFNEPIPYSDVLIKEKEPAMSFDNYFDTIRSEEQLDDISRLAITGSAIQGLRSGLPEAELLTRLEIDSEEGVVVFGEEGEFFCRHGVLEEVLAVHCEGEDEEKHNEQMNSFTFDAEYQDMENYCATPLATQRDEVISALFATVWPEVVDAMRPTVEKVRAVIKEHTLSLEGIPCNVMESAVSRGKGVKRGGWEDDDDWPADDHQEGGDFAYEFGSDSGEKMELQHGVNKW